MKFYLPLGIPIVCSLVSFILAMLVLFAGKDPGFMEDYHIIMLNTSELGKDLIPTSTSSGSSPSSTSDDCGLPGVFGRVCGSATSEASSLASEAASALDDIGDDIADQLADRLGIHEFYSLHVMDACEGDFKPNATAVNAGYNVTNCTGPLQTGQYNITALFDHELSVGPLDLNLADLGFSKDLQDEFDKIPRVLLAMAIFYVLGAAFTGLALLASLASPALIPGRPKIATLANLAAAALAVLVLLVGNLITTAGARPAARKIDDLGRRYGLRAEAGNRFFGIAWAAFALMVVAAAYWAYEFVRSRKGRAFGGSPGWYGSEKYKRGGRGSPAS